MKKSPVRARPATTSAIKPASEIIAEALSRATQKSLPKSKTKSSPVLTPVAASTVTAGKPPRVAAKPELVQTRVTKAPASKKTTVKDASPLENAAKKNAATPVKDVKSKEVKVRSVKATAKLTETTKSPAKAKQVNAKSSEPKKVERKQASVPSTDSSSSATSLRATKKRAPKDLAVQYGEKEKTPRVSLPKATPRKRRDANMRARLQQVIKPDEGVLLRLAQAGAISSSLAPESVADKPLRSSKARRSRKWETLCGKCGASAQYSTSAALCVRCGAILVRD